jgi:hypothetical protein
VACLAADIGGEEVDRLAGDRRGGPQLRDRRIAQFTMAGIAVLGLAQTVPAAGRVAPVPVGGLIQR